MSLAVTLFGTRGSIPSPGPDTVRYGGNTPCLEVTGNGARLILDAGTGIRTLGRRPDTGGQPVAVLLTHTHWDHIQGLPFFAPLHQPGVVVDILGPGPEGRSLESVLHAQLDPAVFPVPAAALAGGMRVTQITTAEFGHGGFEIESIRLCHPGTTFGYRIRAPGRPATVTYMTDNELRAASTPTRASFVRFLRGTTVLVHDAMYGEHEVVHRAGWGHSSAADAVLLALEAEVERLVLFHHDPAHDDAALERLLEEAEACRVRVGGRLDVTLAAEGTTIHCPEEER